MNVLCDRVILFFVCKQKTAYEMRISDWSSDVCSSDLADQQQNQPFADADSFLQDEVFTQCNKGRKAGKTQRGDGHTADFDGNEESHPVHSQHRTEERRVGKEGVSTCRYGGSRCI